MKIKISYDGRYPNLCSGKLVVTIDNKIWNFDEYCLSSGGGFESDWTTYRDLWTVIKWPESFPEELKEQVENEINCQIQHGCCGGCE